MPRETVTPALNTAGVQPDGGHYVPLPTVEVGWQRDLGGVQVGLEVPSESDGVHHLVDHLYGADATMERIGEHVATLINGGSDGCVLDALHTLRTMPTRTTKEQAEDVRTARRIIGRHVLDAVTGASEGYTGWYTHLDRGAVQRLIRLLRKARDAAWGADE